MLAIMCYQLIRPVLFRLPAEIAHDWAISALSYPFWLPSHTPNKMLKTRVAGVNFPSPIGLAAGFDKNARILYAMQKTGFGFMEAGTVTPKPQAGNAKPRLFRLPAHEAIINRFGFNNDGLVAVVSRLKKRPENFIVGGNIGKNKTSDDAVADYVTCLKEIYPLVDYVTANISSPNTPGLRDLQGGAALTELVTALYAARVEAMAKAGVYKPIFIKLAPDLDDAAIKAIAKAALDLKLDGLIIGNTTLARDLVQNSPYANEQGGLSGKPLMQKSTEILAKFYTYLRGEVPLIGVGGVASAEDAYQKITHGASLVQLYSALIYQGFGLVRRIDEGLVQLLQRDGFSQVKDAVGSALR